MHHLNKEIRIINTLHVKKPIKIPAILDELKKKTLLPPKNYPEQ